MAMVTVAWDMHRPGPQRAPALPGCGTNCLILLLQGGGLVRQRAAHLAEPDRGHPGGQRPGRLAREPTVERCSPARVCAAWPRLPLHLLPCLCGHVCVELCIWCSAISGTQVTISRVTSMLWRHCAGTGHIGAAGALHLPAHGAVWQLPRRRRVSVLHARTCSTPAARTPRGWGVWENDPHGGLGLRRDACVGRKARTRGVVFARHVLQAGAAGGRPAAQHVAAGAARGPQPGHQRGRLPPAAGLCLLCFAGMELLFPLLCVCPPGAALSAHPTRLSPRLPTPRASAAPCFLPTRLLRRAWRRTRGCGSCTWAGTGWATRGSSTWRRCCSA